MDQILERALHPAKGANDLLHGAEGDYASHQGRPEGDIGNQDAELQIGVSGHVKIHVVKEQAKIVPPYIGEQRTEPRRGGSLPVVLAVNELLAKSGLDALILELQARQL